MTNIKLGSIEIIFKITLNQNVSLREINDMLLSIKRFPSVSSAIMIAGEEINKDSQMNLNNPIQSNREEKENLNREFPSES